MNDNDKIRGVLQVEAYGIVGPLMRAIIYATAHLCGLEPIIVPWGKEGDLLPWCLVCQNCGNRFFTATSMCNEEIVACKHCKAQFLTGNNGMCAWIIKAVAG